MNAAVQSPPLALGENCFLRTARKEHRCFGHHNGATNVRCDQPIFKGSRYIEYVGESAAYESGHRFHVDCARTHGLVGDACPVPRGNAVEVRQAQADGDYYLVHVERSFRDVVIARGVHADWRQRLAAAPDLLAALQNLVEAQRSGMLVLSERAYESGHDYLTQALDAIERAGGTPLQPVKRAAIAKARGGK